MNLNIYCSIAEVFKKWVAGIAQSTKKYPHDIKNHSGMGLFTVTYAESSVSFLDVYLGIFLSSPCLLNFFSQLKSWSAGI
jgi:hypothetical protein